MPDTAPSSHSSSVLPAAVPFGSAGWWNEYFQSGGGWEQNGGRQQTRVFAEVFCRHIRFDRRRPLRVLDVGCGLGEAIRVMRDRYPNATFTGMDVSKVSISRCCAELGDAARFVLGGIEDVSGFHDVIYISNVLEHFVDFGARARHLARHCERLCIMVPYDERLGDQPLEPNPTRHHQHTFLKDSFDFLLHDGHARRIERHIVSCPGAWSMQPRRWALERCKNVVKFALGRPRRRNRYQIIFDVLTTSSGDIHANR